MNDEEYRRAVDRLGWKNKELEESLKRTDANLENLRTDVKYVMKAQQEDHEAFGKFIALATAAQEAAKEAADKTVTAKQLYVSVAVAVIALAAFLSSIHGI